MCKIKTGANIKSQADVRNLVTAMILRQKKYFERDEITVLAQSFLSDSRYQLQRNELMKIVDDNLDLYCRNKELKCLNGKYIGVGV